MSEASIPFEFAGFIEHPEVKIAIGRYSRQAILAKYAVRQLIADLEGINAEFYQRNHRVAFTTIEGRVKEQDSFMRKLHRFSVENAKEGRITNEVLSYSFSEVKDLGGVRISCPYFDEVKLAVEQLRSSVLPSLGYEADLRSENHVDRDYMETGDRWGYRSYHFYARIPTEVDIFGNVEPCLCEIQVRTELEHVWAVKSHQLIYKPDSEIDELTRRDMKTISDILKSVDELLLGIRQRARGAQTYEL